MAVKRGARRWLVIGSASVVLHAALGWALLAGMRQVPTQVDPQSLIVQLLGDVPPPPPRETPRPARPDAPTHASAPLAVAGPPARPGSGTPLAAAAPAQPPGIVAPPGFTARGTLTGGGEALRQAARRSACTEADIVRLTKAEREACAETLGAKNKNGPALYAAIDPEKKAAFDGDCKKDDEWCLYRTGKGPYPGLFAIGKKKKIAGWDD